jgi:hypothetical protein
VLDKADSSLLNLMFLTCSLYLARKGNIMNIKENYYIYQFKQLNELTGDQRAQIYYKIHKSITTKGLLTPLQRRRLE